MMRLLIAIFASVLCCSTALAQQQTHWVSTWGTAPLLAVEATPAWVQPPPADSLPANPPPSPILPVPAELKDQTLRMIVRTSVAGEQIRLHLSSAQGTLPVTLGAVHIALHAGDGVTVAGSGKDVTFGGKPSVTLRPGAMIVSDAITLPVAALSELAVSVYLPGAADTRSRHELGLNTSYIASGNVASATSLNATEINRSYLWLAGIDVLAPAEAATIAAFGDSITDGFSTTADRHRAWPALLAERLQQNADTAKLGVINLGISGNRVLRNGAGASALTRFDRDVLARSGVSWMLLLEGINDITFTALPGIPASEQATAGDIIEGLSQLVDRAHAHGIKVMGATLTPMRGLWLYTEQTETMRQAVNAWIRSSGKFDALVDFDAITRDPAAPQQLKAEYDSGDHIHPNDAGNAAMAAAIDLNLFE